MTGSELTWLLILVVGTFVVYAFLVWLYRAGGPMDRRAWRQATDDTITELKLEYGDKPVDEFLKRHPDWKEPTNEIKHLRFHNGN